MSDDEQTGRAVDLQQVSYRVGRTVILEGVTLSIAAGSIAALVGPSGSGKTTLVRLIAGLLQPSAGRVTVLGHGVPDPATAARIGYMAQSDALYSELSGEQNLKFFAGLYGLTGKRRSDRIAQLMEWVALASDQKKPVWAYSGGMRRRLSLAIALLSEPDLLILDEPTVGVDPVLRQQFWREFERLRDQGRTLLITTHVMDEANRADRVGFLREGRLLAEGTPQELRERTAAASLEDAFLVWGGR
ncbi:MAG: ABC transporter ATP-binding protein [Thermaerobacter sp.]|nr:ABC transporter ATP-binding protein [Thermaerobacter sp.]